MGSALRGFVTMLTLLTATNLMLSSQTRPREESAKNPPLFFNLARKQMKWDEPAEPARIVGPIYSVGTFGLCEYLIKSSEGLILINTGMPGSGPMTETAIQKLGFDPHDLKL